jgi:adenylate cyclase
MVNGRRRHSATRLYSGDKLQIGSDKTTLVFFQDYTPEVSDDQDDLEEETVAFLQTELVTILVCDIRKFTSLSEIIGAELVSGILTAWSKNVNDLVQKHNGSIDKFIGDAVMATWAAKESQTENILAAMRTLLAIREMTVLLSAKLPNLPWPMEVGGAINIGEAVTGNIGVDGGRDYTVVGDVVNVTFRLEEMTTKAGMDILLGPNVSGYLPHFKDFFTTCKYLVKGKKEPITAYGGSFDKLRIYLQQCQER